MSGMLTNTENAMNIVFIWSCVCVRAWFLIFYLKLLVSVHVYFGMLSRCSFRCLLGSPVSSYLLKSQEVHF